MPEFEARTVKEAIARGLETLGLPQDEVIIEVLDEGRSGVLGVGAKEAVVRITPIPRESEEEAPEMEQPEPVEAPVESDIIAESSPDVTSVTSALPSPPARRRHHPRRFRKARSSMYWLSALNSCRG